MTKHLFSLFAIVLLSLSVTGQDKIITTNHDTLNCEIQKITSNKIFFLVRNGQISAKGKIAKSEVLSFYSAKDEEQQRQAMSEPAIAPMEMPEQKAKATDHGKVRLSILSGMSYLTASSSDAEKALVDAGTSKDAAKDYYNKLKFGPAYGASAHYMVSKDYGVGLKYRLFSTKSSMNGSFDLDDVNMIWGKISEDIFVNYAGLSLFAEQRLVSNPKFMWTSDISAGIAFYRDEATFVGNPLLATGQAFAFDISFGMEYYLTKKLSAGLDLNLFGSNIKKMTVDDGTNKQTQELDKEDWENISRIGLSLGIHLYL